MSTVEELGAIWDASWPGIAPVADELHRLAALDSVWVRFHSLPGSKRYADSAEEAAEVLRRHHVVLADLGLGGRCFVSTSWYGAGDASGLTQDQAAEVHVGSVRWRALQPEPGDAGGELFLHASLEPYPSAGVDDLLQKVGDEQLSGVMILPTDARWIFRPYDGGADVFAPSTSQRDRLADRHRAWLSTHPSGR